MNCKNDRFLCNTSCCNTSCCPPCRTAFTIKIRTCTNSVLLCLGAILTLHLLMPSAYAAGNAHVVNDADVGKPGGCNIETWWTHFEKGSNLINMSPVCILEAIPNLEINANLARQTRVDDDTVTSLGPGFKLMLRPSDTGFGVGLAGNANWNTHAHYWDSSSLIMPLSYPVNDRVQLNLNLGWSYERDSEHKHAAFYGTQVTAAINDQVGLMAEVFQRHHNALGHQVGLRLTPIPEKLDIDVMFGRKIDGSSPRAITVGLTYHH